WLTRCVAKIGSSPPPPSAADAASAAKAARVLRPRLRQGSSIVLALESRDVLGARFKAAIRHTVTRGLASSRGQVAPARRPRSRSRGLRSRSRGLRSRPLSRHHAAAFNCALRGCDQVPLAPCLPAIPALLGPAVNIPVG